MKNSLIFLNFLWKSRVKYGFSHEYIFFQISYFLTELNIKTCYVQFFVLSENNKAYLELGVTISKDIIYFIFRHWCPFKIQAPNTHIRKNYFH